MAILIKGMNFPKTCMACDLEIVDNEDYTTYCPLIYKGYTGKCREDGRLPDCPLVEVAEVQDAVSRQAAIDAINSHFGFNIEEEYGSSVQEVINGLPSAQPDSKETISTHKALDTVSRQAVIDAFDCSVGGVPVESVKYVSEYADKMMSRINALPSAQPEPQWISVSERLPEPMQKVLITFEEYDQLWVTSARFIYYRKTLQWDWDFGSCGEVKAWMPLPEPYKEVTT